ncbi:Hypothetical predicted protein [Paramuricea clavata]|uniref:Uncharacterized protein n=1 Tax=Paramuricea clavata TaxID=317549 RepID=A0A6S7KAV7_PARCT|nr:Hypothetical predicted protein [Paramuricea clavata]
MQNEIAPEASQNNQESDNSPVDDETEPYEEVQISPSSVYAELDRNRQDETTNDGLYQKLLKLHSDYAIPAHTEAESSYEEVGKIKTPPGYTELDNTKRVQDDSACYQKLIKK